MTTLGGTTLGGNKGTVLGGNQLNSKKEINEEIPNLVTCMGSENKRNILESYSKMNDIDFENEEEENNNTGESSISEWALSVTFSKQFTELELWTHFRILFIPELRTKKTGFPSTVYAMSRLYDESIKNKSKEEREIEEEYDGFPIFEDVELLENLYKNQSKSTRGRGGKKGSKKDMKTTNRAKHQKFYELYLWVNIFRIEEFDNEEDEEQENGDEEYQKKRNNTESELLDKADLELLIQTIRGILDKFDPQAKIGYGKTPEEAAIFAEKIAYITEFCNRYITIELEADQSKGFPLPQVWDVMMCLGLEFEPNRREFVLPQANFLNVASSTVSGFNPVYFMDPNYHVSNLLFNLYVPHCKFPQQTLEGIYNIVLYAKTRLGGKILDHNRNQLNNKDQLEQLIQEIKEMCTLMSQFDILPASKKAFQLFY